jgi:hypothetical protein
VILHQGFGLRPEQTFEARPPMQCLVWSKK